MTLPFCDGPANSPWGRMHKINIPSGTGLLKVCGMRWVIPISTCLLLAACGTMRPAAAPLPQPAPAYVVVFPKSSIKIGPKAAAVINQAAVDANLHAKKAVEVAGPPAIATSGYNPGLAAPRALAVERALIAAGVEEKRIVRGTVATATADAAGGRIEIHLIDKPRRKRH